MCSRFTLKLGDAINLSKRLGIPLDQTAAETRNRFNITPATNVTALRRSSRETTGETTTLRWGLIPHWVRDRQSTGSPLINARSETVAEKPAFRTAWRQHQRCALPITGFYEWEKSGRERLPWLFARRDGGPLALAGLWDRWIDPIDGTVTESCTVLTTAPNSLLTRIHDRMPVLLDEKSAAAWLDPELTDATTLIRQFEADRMSATPLDTYVNSTAHHGAACLTRRGEAPGSQFDLGI